MALLQRFLREATFLRVEQWRTCPECRGLGFKPRAARAPDGTIPLRRLVVKVQCDTCKGAKRILLNEEWRDGARPVQVRIYRG